METLIAAEGVFKSFSNRRSSERIRAVDGITLQVKAGEIYGLVGPDGAGKTTFLRLLCGALLPDKGAISVSGFNLPQQVEQARAVLGYLAQRFSLYEDLSVLENIRFFAELRGLKPDEWRPRCNEILEFVNLAEFSGRRAGQLSGGMKQKLGLAAALVHNPQVLLLDEPTTGVDPGTRQDFWQLILHLLAERGIAVLISTPYMDEAARCKRVGFIKNGRILVENHPEVLRSRLAGRIVELMGHPLPLLRRLVQTEQNVQDVQMFGDRLHIRVEPGQQEKVISNLKNLLSQPGLAVDQIRAVAPQLEDVFIDLLEESG